jgi:hypothetical protein
MEIVQLQMIILFNVNVHENIQVFIVKLYYKIDHLISNKSIGNNISFFYSREKYGHSFFKCPCRRQA